MDWQKLLVKRVCLLSYIDVFFKRYLILDWEKIHNQNQFRHAWLFSLLRCVFETARLLNCHLIPILLAKAFFLSGFADGVRKFHYVGWTKNIKLVELLLRGTRI